MPRYRPYDLVSVRQQARRAADFYRARSPRPIYVFPVKRSGYARDFRAELASLLTCGFTGNRERNEEMCAEMGYPFIEVNPANYS